MKSRYFFVCEMNILKKKWKKKICWIILPIWMCSGLKIACSSKSIPFFHKRVSMRTIRCFLASIEFRISWWTANICWLQEILLNHAVDKQEILSVIAKWNTVSITLIEIRFDKLSDLCLICFCAKEKQPTSMIIKVRDLKEERLVEFWTCI